LVPTGQVSELRSDGNVGHLAACIDRDLRRYVGDGVPVARDKLTPAEITIHPLEPLLYDRALRFAVIWELPKKLLEHRVGLPDHLPDRREQLQLHPSVPHLDFRLLAKIAPE
jgi:hypothetical protein